MEIKDKFKILLFKILTSPTFQLMSLYVLIIIFILATLVDAK